MSFDPYGSKSPPPKELRPESDVQSTMLPSRWELRDFVGGWLLLTVAFTFLLVGGGRALMTTARTDPSLVVASAIVSAVVSATGFVLHELAHKLVAVWLGHDAAFRANYGMLGVAIVVSLAGFIFAAPGAVYHRRDVPTRHEGLIALAGPATNVALGFLFLLPILAGVLVDPGVLFAGTGTAIGMDVLLVLIGIYGSAMNFLLAGFNMLPMTPLDGSKVYVWHRGVYAALGGPCILLGAVAYVLAFL